MTDHLDKLEREAEQMLEALADDLHVDMPEAAAVRLRETVSHELNEHWLASRMDATPSRTALEQTKAAVHAELARQGHEPASPTGHRFAAMPWLKGLAVAASIALAIGAIYWTISGDSPPQQTQFAAADQDEAMIEQTNEDLDRLLAAADSVLSDENTIDQSISENLEEIEQLQASSQSWDEELDENVAALAEIMQEIDNILANQESDKSSQAPHGRKQGGMG